MSENSLPLLPLMIVNSVPLLPLMSEHSVPLLPLMSENSVSLLPLMSEISVSLLPLMSENSMSLLPLMSENSVPLLPLIAEGQEAEVAGPNDRGWRGLEAQRGAGWGTLRTCPTSSSSSSHPRDPSCFDAAAHVAHFRRILVPVAAAQG